MLGEQRQASESLEPWQKEQVHAHPSYTNLREVSWHPAPEYTLLRMLKILEKRGTYTAVETRRMNETSRGRMEADKCMMTLASPHASCGPRVRGVLQRKPRSIQRRPILSFTFPSECRSNETLTRFARFATASLSRRDARYSEYCARKFSYHPRRAA